MICSQAIYILCLLRKYSGVPTVRSVVLGSVVLGSFPFPRSHIPCDAESPRASPCTCPSAWSAPLRPPDSQPPVVVSGGGAFGGGGISVLVNVALGKRTWGGGGCLQPEGGPHPDPSARAAGLRLQPLDCSERTVLREPPVCAVR